MRHPFEYRLAVTRRDHALELLDYDGQRSFTTIRNPVDAPIVGAFSSDGSQLAVLLGPKWDAANRKYVREGDSSLWIYSSVDGTLVSKEKTPLLTHAAAIDWKRDVIAILSCELDQNRQGCIIYDITQHKVRFIIERPQDLSSGSGMTTVKLSPDSNVLAIGHTMGEICLWDTRSGKLLRTLKGHLASITALDFSGDGLLASLGNRYDGVRVWDVATGKLLREFSMGALREGGSRNVSVSFVYGGSSLLACGTSRGDIVVFKMSPLVWEPIIKFPDINPGK